MLLSKHIVLRAAFDHRHVFLDPTPDPARSFAERKRLFDLARSSWADYDKSLISAGGGIFERSAKSIALTDEVKAAFGIDPAVTHLTPAELIRRLLTSEADLLWLGGIGTYVKSSAESNAEVGDKANDSLRVDARDLRALVIGEGANLGFTQRGRVEAALTGRRINTDAIDNSAGVDTSDHEVNIKILLRDVIDRGQMTRTQRDQLLAQMTDEVGALVLADNYKQTQALTVAEAVAPEALEDQVRVMRQLEKAGRLNRAIEFLPNDEQAAERAQSGRGLTRPELAVLLAYSKIDLYDKLLASELPDEPKMVEDLVRYFPQPLKEKFVEAIGAHRLRREIIATVATNGMVNRVGPAFVAEMVEQTGMGEGDVARSYIAVREAFALRNVWEGIEALDTKVPARTQTAMVLETNKLMRRTIPWLLVRGKFPLDVAAETARLGPAAEALAGAVDKVLPEGTLAELKQRSDGLAAEGVPAKLARRIATLPILAAVPDIAHIAAETKAKVEAVAAVYFAVEDGLGFGWLRARALAFRTDNHWQRQAAAALVEDLFALQGRLAERVMAGCESGVKDASSAAACVAAWTASRPGPVERVQGLLAELRAVAMVDLSMLSVAARQLRGLVAG
jgi:glutamate dehydrogenase